MGTAASSSRDSERPIDVVCLGILVADIVAGPIDEPPLAALTLLDDVSLHGGGCALNTATGLKRLGLETAVAGMVGNDTFGDFLLRLLDERGIHRAAVARSTAPTSATVILVGGDGEQRFLHRLGASASLRAENLDPEALCTGRALHVAGALVMPSLDGEPTASLLARARARGLLTSLDTAFDATGHWRRVEPCLPWLDLFLASRAEARAISGEEDIAAAAAWVRKRGAREVAIKLGVDGAYLAGPDFEGHVPAYRVAAVDGTGAGDAFAAGLLYGRLAGWPLEKSAHLANAAGALATTAAGATEGLRSLEEALAIAGLQG